MLTPKLIDEEFKTYPLFPFEFINCIGVVCNSYFITHLSENRVVFYENLKRISVKKRRKLTFNLIFLLTSILLASSCFVFDYSKVTNISVIVLCALCLCFFFFFKQYEYFLIFIDYNLNFFEYKVHNYAKDDLKIFVKKVKYKIKNSSSRSSV